MATKDQYLQQPGTSGQLGPLQGPYLDALTKPLVGSGDSSTQTVLNSKPASTAINQVKTGVNAVNQALSAQSQNNAGQQTVTQQAASSATDFATLLKNNPAAAYYRSFGRDPNPQELAQFQQQNNPDVQNGLTSAINGATSALSNIDPATGQTRFVDPNNANPTGGKDAFGNTYGGDTSSTPGSVPGSQGSQSGLIDTDQRYQQYEKDVASLQNGTFPLTPQQQALLDSTKTLYNQLRTQQEKTNQAFEGGTKVLSQRRGNSQNAPDLALSNFHEAVSSGVQKIAEIEAKASNALANLQSGFQSDNLKMVTDSFSQFQKYANDKNTQLMAIQKAAQDSIKDQRDFSFKQEQANIDNMFKYEQFDYNKGKDAIEQAFKVQSIDLDQKKFLETKLNNQREYDLNLKKFSHQVQQDSIDSGDNNFDSLQIAAQEYSATGKMPTWISKEDAAKVAVLSQSVKQPPGRLVDATTNRPSTQLSATQESGIIALNDVIKKLDAAKTAFGTLNTGLFGKVGSLNPSDDRIIYDSLKGEIISLLNQARSGQAVTEQEYARAIQKLPGYMNNTLGIGTNGVDKIDQLKKSLEGTLSNNLSLNGLRITDTKKVDVDAKTKITEYRASSPENDAKAVQIMNENPDLDAEEILQILPQ